MKIAVFANKKQWDEIKSIKSNINWILITSLKKLPVNLTALFVLKNTVIINYKLIDIPIFINSVTTTLKELNTPLNVCRINGWNGFLLRPCWEIAGVINEEVQTIIMALDKKIVIVPDEPGLIVARIIAMIINEAWFAFEAKVSTKKEIDIAMKLGTNYPFGPFEWGQIIGKKNIVELLITLSLKDKKYTPAPSLKHNIIK